MPRRATRALMLAVVLVMSVLVPVLPASAATAPGTPTSLKALATIEGVHLTWAPAGFVAGVPSATGWVVTRSGPGIDRSWTIAGAGFPWQLDDDELATGVVASYTVRATAGGVDGAATDPVTAAKLADPRPFIPARQALVVTWGQEDADHQSAALLDGEGEALVATPVAGGVAITRKGYSGIGPSLTAPWPVTDGTYEVGTGAGQLDVSVAGTRGACTGATGSLAVARAVPSRVTYWAAVSLDADLTCSDGSTVRAHGRLATPETVPAVTGPQATAIGVAPGLTGSTAHLVRNIGQESLDVQGVRLLRTANGPDPAGVLSADLGSCSGRTLAPGDTCLLQLHEARPATDDPAQTYSARVAVTTGEGESTVGTVFGTDRDELAGPQAVTALGKPGVTDVTWTPGSANSFSTYTVLDEEGKALGSAGSSPVRVNGLAPGAHLVRLRQVLDDGRIYTTAPLRFVVPEEWLFVDSGASGVRAVGVSGDPDVLDGLRIAEVDGGTSLLTSVRLASSPTRLQHAAFDRFSGHAWMFSTNQIQTSWDTPQSKSGRYSPDGKVLAAQVDDLLEGNTVVTPGSILLRAQATGIVTAVPKSHGWGLADWTPDGKFLLVVPADGPGLYRMDPVNGSTVAVPGAGDAGTARVSRTGELAVYRYADGTLYAMPLAGGAKRNLGIDAFGLDYTWDPTGTRIALGSPAWLATGNGELWDVSGTPHKIRDLPTSRSVTWVDPVSSAPAPAATVAAWTTAAPTVTVTATDPDDAPGGLRTQCRLDAAATWVPCAGAWKPGTLSAGQHQVVVRSTDPAGVTGERTSTWKVDPTAPTAALSTPAAATLSTSLPLAWSGTDTGGSGLARYDVRYRRASVASGLGAYTYPATLQGTTARSTTLTVSAGYQYCLSVRARDAAGNLGAWSAEKCSVVALDDRSLAATAGWTRGTSSSYVYGTWSRATSSRATLTRSGVSARRVGLVVTTCSTCGSVDVWVGSTYAGRVSLVASTTHTKQVKWLTAFATTKTGTLTLRTTSAKKSYVDAALVAH